MIRKNSTDARERADAGFEVLLESLKMQHPEWDGPDPVQIEVMRTLYMAGFENGAEFVYDEMGSSEGDFFSVHAESETGE
jgi:hypothetical protein